MQRGVCGAALFVFATGALAQSPPGAHLTLGYRLKFHAKRVAGPGALAAIAAGAALGMLTNEPREWGQGADGYGRRFGYLLAVNAVNQAINFGASAALKEDLRYFPSGRKGVWTRAWSATEHTLAVYKEGGGRTFAYSRVLGAYGAGFLSNTWYPARVSNTAGALQRGTVVLGADVGANIFREFWPDIKNRLFHKP